MFVNQMKVLWNSAQCSICLNQFSNFATWLLYAKAYMLKKVTRPIKRCHRYFIQLSLYIVWMNARTERSIEIQQSTDLSGREQHSLYGRTVLIFNFPSFRKDGFSDVRNLSHSISRENDVTCYRREGGYIRKLFWVWKCRVGAQNCRQQSETQNRPPINYVMRVVRIKKKLSSATSKCFLSIL